MKTATRPLYTGDVLKTGFNAAQAFVVLMTPDDEARLREAWWGDHEELYETELTPQPRPNVIYEAGMAMGIDEGRTVLIQMGKLRPMSGILGRHVIRIDDTHQKRKALAQRLQLAGCPAKLVGDDWSRRVNLIEHWRVFDEAAVVPPPPAKKLPLSLVFTMTRGGGNQQEERFHLQVSLESTRRLSDYYVEVEFPSAFLNPFTSYSPEIRERRTATHYVFKATPEDSMTFLNPGSNNLMGIEFFVKRDGSQQEIDEGDSSGNYLLGRHPNHN
jgi:predicted nucleotide-binding protein with TIR-like domain